MVSLWITENSLPFLSAVTCNPDLTHSFSIVNVVALFEWVKSKYALGLYFAFSSSQIPRCLLFLLPNYLEKQHDLLNPYESRYPWLVNKCILAWFILRWNATVLFHSDGGKGGCKAVGGMRSSISIAELALKLIHKSSKPWIIIKFSPLRPIFSLHMFLSERHKHSVGSFLDWRIPRPEQSWDLSTDMKNALWHLVQ